ncbi:MAG: hypothetical protein HC765_01845 [Brachymonas sp.]|nr:hypothetical protein [Brachymonas sp.]
MDALDADLRALLQDTSRWRNRPIRVIDQRRSAASHPLEVVDSEKLEEIWDQALMQEQQPSGQTSQAITTARSPRELPPRNR